eukprot:m.331398 g.331398  ORF g.331398 m.331398 type:complete len:255 (+) comp20476_c0_seq4:150-914(+)
MSDFYLSLDCETEVPNKATNELIVLKCLKKYRNGPTRVHAASLIPHNSDRRCHTQHTPHIRARTYNHTYIQTQVLKAHEDSREPSLGDLRTVRSKLEKEYFSGISTEEPSSKKIQPSGQKPRANGIQNVTRPRTPGGKALPPIALSSMRSPQSQLAGTPRSPTTSTTTPTSVLSPSTAPTTSLPPSKTPSLDGRPRRASRVRPPGTAHADATTAQHSPRTPRGEQKLLTSPPQPRPPPPASRHVRPRPPPGKRH